MHGGTGTDTAVKNYSKTNEESVIDFLEILQDNFFNATKVEK